MKLIDISTPKHPNTFAMVDDEDYPLVAGIRWGAHKNKNVIYASRLGGKWTPYETMHQILLPAPKGLMTDHKNGNGLDNRRENLRLVSRQQNVFNQSKRQGSVSEYKGVTLESERPKPWRARIKISGRSIHIGRFSLESEAAEAYNRAAIKHFGEFARLNTVRIASEAKLGRVEPEGGAA